MAIIQKPDSLSLSGNIKKFIISSGSLVSFKLSEGGSTLIDEIYDPGAQGRVEIDIRQVVEGRLSFSLAGSNFYTQSGIVKSFTAVVDGSSVSFKVVRAGVDNIADTPSNWLTNNFLTWQPTTKAVSYHSPEWITYYAVQASTLKLRATFDDNSTHTISLGSMSAGSAYTANVQYALVAGLLGQRYPIYFDVWAESSGGARLTYSQRYYYSLPLADIEQWYLFENSLGGIDTLRTSGATLFEGSHAHELSVIDGVATEFNVDTERIYTQHTGALDTYQRRWLADLYPSRRKYLHHQGSFRPIVFTDGIAQYSTGDLPSNFSFSFRFANDSRGLLNLIRNEASIPTNITLPNLSAPNFILPPRLSEYPRISLSEGVILPAFDPHSETPKITTVGALIAAAVAEALGAIPGGDGSPGGGGQLVNIIKEHSLSAGTDNDVFSSNRTRKEINDAIHAFADSIDDYLGNLDEKYLSKINPDSAASIIKFMEGAQFGEFLSGMLAGTGARIDKYGNIEATSLILRAFLEAPELRFNRLTVIGDELILTESGLIEDVEHLEGAVYKLTLKLEEGDAIAFHDNDLVKGIFHHGTGFFTSYMIVNEVGLTFIKVSLANASDVPPQINMPPRQFMNIARVGNATNPERQRYIVASSKVGGIQVYDGASTFMNATLVGSMDTAQAFKDYYGDLPLKPGLLYMYAAGLVVQDIIRVDYQGVPVREIYDRGPWEAGRTYYNNDIQGTDDVWHLGCRWRCFSISTTQEPSYVSQSWIMLEGSSETSMDFYSSNGLSFHAGQVDTTFTPIAYIGNVDVSNEIEESNWSWTRESGNSISDDAWNAQHKGMRLLEIKNEDMTPYWTRLNPIKFICTAIHPGTEIENFINVRR